MLDRIRNSARQLGSSLWFVPGLHVLGAIALAFAMTWVDERVSREPLKRFPLLFGAGAESSRQMLAAIAGSMITVAGVTFSITVVAVTQASSQYTPRILRNFMSDRPSQVVLGVFVGVFTYCLVVLRTIRGAEELRFIPALSVMLAFLLAIVAIGFLIYFIHHIAESLQAAGLLARINRDTTKAVDRLFPEGMGGEVDADADAAVAQEAGAGGWTPVPAGGTGYVENLDEDGLLALAESAGTVIRMEIGVGEFVVEGEPLASVAGPAETVDAALTERLNALYGLRAYRTVQQDVGFGIRQLVDVALRALSPSSNDSTTAIGCVDYLSGLLSRLAQRRIPGRVREAHGRALVIARGPTFTAMLDTAFDQIRRSAEGNVEVLARMLSALETIAHFTRSVDRRADLRRHVWLIQEAVARSVPAAHDRERLDEACARALETVWPVG